MRPGPSCVLAGPAVCRPARRVRAGPRPAAASNRGPLVVGGKRTRIRGRVCMDQFVAEIPRACKAGDTAYLFGGGDLPTADDWAEAAQTIGYEIVSRLGARVPRSYHG